MDKTNKCAMDGGEHSFCLGVEKFADSIGPGLGGFISSVVKNTMESNGWKYTEPISKEKTKKNHNHSFVTLEGNHGI